MSESVRSKRNSDVGCMLIHVSNLLKKSQPHEMPAPERSVLLACADSANKDDGYRWALGNESIRRFTGLSESEVRTCKKTLEAHGWISVEQRKRTVPGFDKDGKRIMKVIYDADIITVHPDFGQWWEEPAPRASCRSKNFKAKKTIATPVPGEGPPALHGTPPIPGEGPSCLENTTLLVVTTSNLQDLSYLQDLQEREAADATALALLTAPSTREVVIEAAPVTSPSPMATQEIAQTVQAPIQTTFPGMEAPTAVKEAKTRRRANSGAAKTKLTADEKKAKRDAAIDAWTPSPDTVAEQKRLRISDDQIKAIRLKFKRSFKKAQIPEQLDALCVELMLEIPEYRRNSGVANRNAGVQPMQTVVSEDRHRKF